MAAHERLGEVLRILRTVLERYAPLQSTELFMAAGALIQQVKRESGRKSSKSNVSQAGNPAGQT